MAINVPNLDYYLWSQKSSYHEPWKRQYLNTDFLDYENKRIKLARNWYNTFEKTEIGSKLDLVELHCLQADYNRIYPYRKALLSEYKDYEFICLSALSNSVQYPILALIEKRKLPEYHSLIRIDVAQKKRLMGKSLDPLDVVLILEYQTLHSDKILVDVPVENNFVSKIISENLVDDKTLSIALQSPLLSSPPNIGELGGISLTSFSDRSGFNKKVIKNLMHALPPFYSNIRPTKKTVSGYSMKLMDGLSIRVAEKFPKIGHYAEGITDNSNFDSAMRKRVSFDGEYSILSNFSHSHESGTRALLEDITSFGRTEVFIPRNLDKSIDDKKLHKFEREINEDFWIQIAHARQFSPNIQKSDNLFVMYKEYLKNDFDALVTNIGKSKESYVEFLAEQNIDSLVRNAKSLARSESTDILQEHHFKKSRDLLNDTFYDFWNSSDLSESKYKVKHEKDPFTNQIRMYLTKKRPMKDIDIWRGLERSTLGNKTFHDLVKHLKSMHVNTMVIKNNDEYSLVYQ